MFEVGKDVYRFGGRIAKHRDIERSRLRTVHFWICVLFCVFFAKTLYYGCIGTDKSGKAKLGTDWMITRADIVDRNGVVLAKNIVSGHIMVRPGAVKDIDAVAQKIHEVFPYKYSLAAAYDILHNKKFMYLKQYATDAERKQIKDAKLEGLEVEVKQMRRYPKHDLFAHVVGFVGKEGEGLEGAEQMFDSYLRENNDPLRLSLDARIQEQFHTRLTEAVQKYHAIGILNTDWGDYGHINHPDSGTKGSKDADFGTVLVSQLFGIPRVMYFVGTTLSVLGLVTPLNPVLFCGFGMVFIIVGRRMSTTMKTDQIEEEVKQEEEEAEEIESNLGIKENKALTTSLSNLYKDTYKTVLSGHENAIIEPDTNTVLNAINAV